MGLLQSFLLLSSVFSTKEQRVYHQKNLPRGHYLSIRYFLTRARLDPERRNYQIQSVIIARIIIRGIRQDLRILDRGW